MYVEAPRHSRMGETQTTAIIQKESLPKVRDCTGDYLEPALLGLLVGVLIGMLIGGLLYRRVK